MYIIYRISNNSYPKNRIKTATKINCLKNALNIFIPSSNMNWIILGDNLNNETFEEINLIIKNNKYIKLEHIYCGSGASSFNKALDRALNLNDNEIVYFIEDDYIHLYNSYETILEGIKLGADYVTLYLHPDKFIAPQLGGNPNVDEDGGCVTKIYRGETQLFGWFDSTTMTFASTVYNLKKDEYILREYTKGTYPRDFEMFLRLKDEGKVLLCPVNTKSTHAEVAWLSPIDGIKIEYLENIWINKI